MSTLTGLSSFDNEAVQVRLTITGTILPACRVKLLEHALAFAIEDQMSPELSSTRCWTRLDLQTPSHRRKTLNVVLKRSMVLDDKILAFVAESIKICPDTKLAQWTACVWMAKRCWNQIWNLMCWNTRTNVTTCHMSPWAQNSSLQNKQHDNDPTLRIQPHLSPNCANHNDVHVSHGEATNNHIHNLKETQRRKRTKMTDATKKQNSQNTHKYVVIVPQPEVKKGYKWRPTTSKRINEEREPKWQRCNKESK